MILNEENFIIFAGKYYDMKKAASEEEFSDDVKRFQYLKRLFRRYDEDEDLRIRLIMNHIIILYNCFGRQATPMLFYKLKGYHHYLKPFLAVLNHLPEVVEYEGRIIHTETIPMDPFIVSELKKI